MRLYIDSWAAMKRLVAEAESAALADALLTDDAELTWAALGAGIQVLQQV